MPPLDLTDQQERMAQMIMRVGRKRGIPRNRLRELAYASFKEAGLNPNAENPSSGAAGLFQLLSPHYRERAEGLGGLFNPRANLLSILPDYLNYWKKYPRAPAGQAARDVERSGEGSDWYAPTQEFISALGGLPKNPPRVTNSQVDIDPGGMPNIDRRGLTSALMAMVQGTQQTGMVDTSGIIDAWRDMHAEQQQRLAELQDTAGVPMTQGVSAPGGSFSGILNSPLPTSSEFATVDAEGAPGPGGKRYHAALDWFADPGSAVQSPITGTIVEVRPSEATSGQIYGGVVKVQGPKGRVWVFRHVDPKNFKVGQKVRRGQTIAGVTDWDDGSDHVHIELWKSLGGGYNVSNMIDPLSVLS
jgi:murein DD-endopeptidase MepM/ murein hydrolase activator NlpD